MPSRSRDYTGSKMNSDLNGLQPELTDEQWSLISDLFPNKPVGPKGGRRRVNSRACFEGILWGLRSGARWKDMPPRFPSYATCWRRFAEWSCDEIWDVALRRLLDALDQKGKISWKEEFADGTFASAGKGGLVGKTKRGKGTKLMVLTDGNGLPLAIDVEAANRPEGTLIERLLDSAITDYVPNKLI